MHTLAHHWTRALTLAAALLLLQAGGGAVRDALRFSRQAIEHGEWWRLFSAHFVHLGWAHAALNALGVLLCCALAPQLFNRHVWLKTAALALLATAGWMLWQWGVGPSTAEQAMIGGRIISIAHVYGFGLGFAGVLMAPRSAAG